MAQNIYLIRHAESEIHGTYCGSSNAGLSPKGMEQAQKLCSFLNSIPLQICYVSPLLRAQLTIEPLRANPKIQFIPAEGMREMHFGAWEALPFADVQRQWPEIYEKWMQSPTTVDIPGAETFAAFVERVRLFMQELAQCQAEHVAVVAHAGSLSVLTLLFLQKPLSEFWTMISPNASISTFVKTGLNGSSQFKLKQLHEVSHL